MVRFVAFLRAINTPPRYVKMEAIRASFAHLGLENVSTFIASGNVVFETEQDAALAHRIEQRLRADLGFEVPVYLRTGAEVVRVADQNPFGSDTEHAEISFLSARPDPAAVAAIVAATTGEDRLAVIDREVWWYHPGDRAQSDHSEAQVVKFLGMQTTRRSVRTVRRLTDKYLR